MCVCVCVCVCVKGRWISSFDGGQGFNGNFRGQCQQLFPPGNDRH